MLDGPPGVVLLVVVFRAEVREIVVVRETVILPILRMVEIAAPSGGTASRGPAGLIPHAKPGAEVWRNRIAVATEGEHRTGLRVGENSHKTGGSGGKFAGGIDIDRTIALELCRLRAPTEESEHRHRDEHGHPCPSSGGWGGFLRSHRR